MTIQNDKSAIFYKKTIIQGRKLPQFRKNNRKQWLLLWFINTPKQHFFDIIIVFG